MAHQVGPDGKWRSMELPGPSSLEAWEGCFAVFRTAAIMDGTAHPASLDKYADEFKRRVRRYPWCWHLALQADLRCRTEFWLDERRRQEAFHASSPTLSTFSPQMPWDAVIRVSSTHLEFWTEEFKDPAVLYQKDAGPPVMSERASVGGQVREHSRSPLPRKGRGDGSKKTGSRPGQGGSDERRSDGRYVKSEKNEEICFAWNRSKTGCGETECHSHPKRAHVCEWCRGPHRAVTCKPGWSPPVKLQAAASVNKGRRKHR